MAKVNFELPAIQRDRLNKNTGYNELPTTIDDGEGNQIPNPEYVSPHDNAQNSIINWTRKACCKQYEEDLVQVPFDGSNIK